MLRESGSRFVRLWGVYLALPRWMHGLVIAASLLLATGAFVIDGRPASAVVQIYFIPLLLAALRFKVVGGVLCGVLCGLLAGPASFALTQTGAAAAPWHWLAYLVSMSVLGAVVGGMMSYARSRTERLLYHLYTDPATSLPNLQALRRGAQRLAHHGGSAGQSGLTKAAVRLTNYQSLVNAFGYGFADETMRRLAERLRDNLPPHYLTARVGPSTLAVIADGHPESHVDECLALLSPAQQVPILVQDIPVYPDIAVGMAGTGAGPVDVERLFSNAEAAASEAEASNRRLVVYQPGSHERQEARVRLLGEVGAAMRSGQVQMAFQPRLRLRDQQVVSLEALARWQHPQRGWIPPGMFIPLVEETRLIDPFTIWALRTAIAQLASWRVRGFDVCVAVNVSTRNLTQHLLVEQLALLLEEFGVPASAIELEITESAFIEITDDSLSLLHELRALGTRIAIDDFGTGYASLAYLRRLPLDILKLDKSFILEGLGKPQDQLMVRRMVQMAKDRDLVVVAEGVESEAALTKVREFGCDEAQGFHINRPLFPADIEPVLCERAQRFTAATGSSGG